jgi:hypothetical protein
MILMTMTKMLQSSLGRNEKGWKLYCFLFGMEDLEFAWTKLTATSSRGVKITVTNNTLVRFVLLDARLESGDWVKTLPLELAAKETIKFACLTNAMFTGTSGRALFASPGRDKSLRIEWSNPYAFFSSAEVIASANGGAFEASVQFSCGPHSAGYYLSARIELNTPRDVASSPLSSPSAPRRAVKVFLPFLFFFFFFFFSSFLNRR